VPSRAKTIAELVERYIDPVTTKIEDWQWRPLADVHRDTGYIEEVPAYIQDNFGRFMLDQTDRARRGEMGPRDMLKGYGIVSSSIMRGARDPESLVKSGLKIYDADPGEIRPEGAFANWLMSPLGQRYLDLGSTGVADLEAIEDIRRGFRPFGRQNELAESLKYAAEELAPRGAELNELVLGSADDWRRFTEGVNGVSAGKSGFLASMFGRGDIPTFDTRQVILHTGLPSKLINKYMGRSVKGRPIGGYEAVDRQAARQAALDLGIDPALLDQYQHLAHHAIWDRIGNEQTTHKDLIRTLRPGMAKGGLVALMERALKLAQERAALPVEQHGLGLHPLNTPAERAAAMGFDTDAYHSTKHDPSVLLPRPPASSSRGTDFGVHVGDADTAFNAIIPSHMRRYYTDVEGGEKGANEIANRINGSQIMPLKVNPGRVLEVPDFGRWDYPGNLLSNVVKETWSPPHNQFKDKVVTNDPDTLRELVDMANSAIEQRFEKPQYEDALERIVKGRGYDSIAYKNDIEGDGAMSRMFFDPDRIRSRFAVFDPWRKDAATAAALGLAAPDLLAAEPDGKAKGGLVGLAEKYLPRMMSIFSGGGTLEHGLEGMVRPVMAVEKDPDIARHYARAHGDHVVTSDVRDIDFGPMAGEVDYLHASPSCTNYSSAGCRTESPIDLMTADATARAIRDIRPPLFTLENVPAYQGREAFRKIADQLNEQGYNWDIVRHNAADLGAPSSRNRMMVRASLGDLPPAQQYWPKSGDWFPAIEDQLESMRPSQLAPWQLRRLAERGIDPESLDTPLLVGGGSGFKGDIPLAFAGRPGITVLSSPVQTDRVVLPGGDVRALNPRSYARLLGLSDSYPLPDDRNLAKIIVGNGMAPAMTREVVEPLLNQRLINMVEKYK
jgi:DNA (cytosine-5)-methyltransferase 1